MDVHFPAFVFGYRPVPRSPPGPEAGALLHLLELDVLGLRAALGPGAARIGLRLRAGSGVLLRPLGLEWAPFIFAHYGKSDIGGLPHIEEAVRQGMLGAFVDGELAGFVGFHPEGSIGLLEVLPPYRRRGLGEVLLLGAVRLALERGQYAFGQVLVDNGPSLALQKKAGLTVSEDTLYWLFRPES